MHEPGCTTALDGKCGLEGAEIIQRPPAGGPGWQVLKQVHGRIADCWIDAHDLRMHMPVAKFANGAYAPTFQLVRGLLIQ